MISVQIPGSGGVDHLSLTVGIWKASTSSYSELNSEHRLMELEVAAAAGM